MSFPKNSNAGVVAAILFLLAAASVFVMHIHSVKANAADSGESAIPFFLLTLPWMLAIPESVVYSPAWGWAAYPVAWICVGINAVILYGVVGLTASVLSSVATGLFRKKTR